MKKLTTLALLACVVMAAPAFAVQRNLVVAPNATFATAAPSTTNNNDSCDIGVTPAATLLLPYFEVDISAAATAAPGTGTTTLFTVTNTSRYPQIAHVTLWTDWSFPVLDFNLYLTGYDVAPINLFDVIVRGNIAPQQYTTTAGTTLGGTVTSPGPLAGTTNPYFGGGVASNCANIPGGLPGAPPAGSTTGASGLVAGIQAALSTGSGAFYGCTSTQPIGGNHAGRAIGYVTVDVASDCSALLPTDPAYYTGGAGVGSILFDNTLIGDYQQLSPSGPGSAGTGFDAAGNPMVHIRAIPEGGPAGAAVPTNFAFTFYNRYAGASNLDRRQPLPSTWAARYVQGTSGAVTLGTNFKIWREGQTGAAAAGAGGVPSCAAISAAASTNSAIPLTQLVRFDEHENAFGFGTNIICSPCAPGGLPALPETSLVASSSTSTFPPGPNITGGTTDMGGWMYMNLANTSPGSASALTASRAGFGGTGATFVGRTTTQNWVVISMVGNVGTQRLAADFDAAWLANGCTPAPANGAVIAPGSQRLNNGQLVCPPGVACPAGTTVYTFPVPNPTP